MSESLTQFSQYTGNTTSASTSTSATATAASSTPTIPANAEAPVWQPWVNSQAQALSALKTEISGATTDYDKAVQEAQRLFDVSLSIAAEQTRRLEAAAWASWTKYMDEAARIETAIMTPASQAYEQMIEGAKNAFLARINPVQHAYARVVQDTTWSKNLTTGSATIGVG